MSLAVGARLGPYEIQSLIGAGGMGEVWRARDTRLEREARLASKLNHPHICTIYEVGETGGQTYIAMELVEGQALSARVEEGPLPVDQVLRSGPVQCVLPWHVRDRPGLPSTLG